MNPFRLVLAYLRHRPLLTALNIVLLALGIATIVVLLLFSRQAEDRLKRDSRGIDLVIGAKGSPMQLILSSIYHLDVPTGNIPMAEAQPIISDLMVKRAIPLALGDSHKGFRIVGTSRDFADLYDLKPVQGDWWKSSLEAVIGAQVARDTGLAVGANFSGAHGLTGGGAAHADHPYKVVGVLAPTGTVADRLVLTSVDSVWKVHEEHAAQPKLADVMAQMLRQQLGAKPSQPEAKPAKPGSKASKSPAKAAPKSAHDDHDHDAAEDGKQSGERTQGEPDGKEVTAYLIQYATPLAAAAMPRRVNSQSALQAASPAYETARLLSMLGMGFDTLRIFAIVLVSASALGIFIALTNALEERRQDLALLRVLGASPGKLLLLVMLEGVTLTVAGVILGLLLGHLGAQAIGSWLADTRQITFTGWIWLNEELWLIAGALALGLAAALVPAVRTYRRDIAPLLAQR
jgi:putative ABC transport system permease protein